MRLQRLAELVTHSCVDNYSEYAGCIVIQVVDFISLAGQPLLFWRVTLSMLMIKYKDTESASKALSALSSSDASKSLHKSILLFFKSKLGPWAQKLNLAHSKWLSEVEHKVLLSRMKAVAVF